MEDLLQHFDNPNIMDIKIGTRWDMTCSYMYECDRQLGQTYHFLICTYVTGNQVRYNMSLYVCMWRAIRWDITCPYKIMYVCDRQPGQTYHFLICTYVTGNQVRYNMSLYVSMWQAIRWDITCPYMYVCDRQPGEI